jgi:hypothetical protein
MKLFKMLLVAITLPFAAAAQTDQQAAIERKVYICSQKRLIHIKAVAANVPNPLLRPEDRQSMYDTFIRCYPMLKDSISFAAFPRVAIENSAQYMYVRAEMRRLCASELRQLEMDAFFEEYLKAVFELIEALGKK